MSNTNSKKPSLVHVIQIAHTGRDGGTIPPTNLVYGTKTALLAGIKRLIENEKRRLVQLSEFEKELGRDVDAVWRETTDVGSFFAWIEEGKWQCNESLAFAAVETLNKIPDEFKIYQYTLTDERVSY